MLNLDPFLLLLLIGSLYILVFGGMSLLRREGLSIQFAMESIVVTVVLVGISWLLSIQLSPFVFLILLYVVTMRSRLAVEIANMLARQRRYDPALRLYDFALALRPDAASRLVVLTNRGAAELRMGHVQEAIDILESVLATERFQLGLKYEAACRYNLAFAYEKDGQNAKATAQYNEVIDLLPGSVYAQAAQSALKRQREKDSRD